MYEWNKNKIYPGITLDEPQFYITQYSCILPGKCSRSEDDVKKV